MLEKQPALPQAEKVSIISLDPSHTHKNNSIHDSVLDLVYEFNDHIGLDWKIILQRNATFFFSFFCCLSIRASFPWGCSHTAHPTNPMLSQTQGGPCRQRSTGGDIRSLAGYHPKKTLHCCWVTAAVVLSKACSDSTCAEHHLLCPLLFLFVSLLNV